MPFVWVPPQMRDLTGGRERVEASGRTVAQVIDDLERRFPGFKARLMRGNRLNPSISVAVDGAVAERGLLQPVGEESEVTFIPAISGG